jgi:hypothetical protein
MFGQVEDLAVRRRATTALDAMERSTTPLSSVQSTEAEILHMAWRHSQHFPKQAKVNIVEQLADCVQKTQVVCTTGRVTRVVAAFEGLDDKVELKSEAMVQQLILSQLAPRVQAKQEKAPDGELSEEDIGKLIHECMEWAQKEYTEFPRLVAKIPEWIRASL